MPIPTIKYSTIVLNDKMTKKVIVDDQHTIKASVEALALSCDINYNIRNTIITMIK